MLRQKISFTFAHCFHNEVRNMKMGEKSYSVPTLEKVDISLVVLKIGQSQTWAFQKSFRPSDVGVAREANSNRLCFVKKCVLQMSEYSSKSRWFFQKTSKFISWY